ncbi:MAG: D-glycero-beta-D-manno-heptose-7-phosphate kinase [Candidatus Riflebacteria bacterium]|nr:D-glycero-beta-D-manno-heptose-7-phosphate kinase [Candidatus Riflebacteria bacterium]
MLTRTRLKKLLTQFAGHRLAVLGDVMLDEFVWGRVDRISPEAPVPVVQVKKETWRAGGAANVASNLRSFGARAHIFGVIGDDGNGRKLAETLRAEGIDTAGLVTDSGRRTSVKTRILGQNQQMIRIDREATEAIDYERQKAILDHLTRLLPELDGVIVSDYAKGVVVGDLLTLVIERFKKAGKFVAVDPKLKNYPLYKKASIITPNTREAEAALGRVFENEADVLQGGADLLEQFRTDAVLITRGEHGMSLFEKGKKPITIPTQAIEVFDVTGAGDTVIATFSLALAGGCTMPEAAEIANLAAGVVVGIVGTATASADSVLAHFDRISLPERHATDQG